MIQLIVDLPFQQFWFTLLSYRLHLNNQKRRLVTKFSLAPNSKAWKSLTASLNNKTKWRTIDENDETDAKTGIFLGNGVLSISDSIEHLAFEDNNGLFVTGIDVPLSNSWSSRPKGIDKTLKVIATFDRLMLKSINVNEFDWEFSTLTETSETRKYRNSWVAKST